MRILRHLLHVVEGGVTINRRTVAKWRALRNNIAPGRIDHLAGLSIGDQETNQRPGDISHDFIFTPLNIMKDGRLTASDLVTAPELKAKLACIASDAELPRICLQPGPGNSLPSLVPHKMPSFGRTHLLIRTQRYSQNPETGLVGSLEPNMKSAYYSKRPRARQSAEQEVCPAMQRIPDKPDVVYRGFEP